jgi:hypothetical protein
MNPQAELRALTGTPAIATDGPTTTLDKIVARGGANVEIPLLESTTSTITTANIDIANIELLQNSSGSTPFSEVRHTVVSGRRGLVHADFLEAGTGLQAIAKADSNDPIITTIAAGFDDFGRPINYINKTTSDITFSGLTEGAVNYLGLKRESNGTLTPVKTTIQPVYDTVFNSDRENKVGVTFNFGNAPDNEPIKGSHVDLYGNCFRFGTDNIKKQSVPFGTGTSVKTTGSNDARIILEANNKINLGSLKEWSISSWFYLYSNTEGCILGNEASNIYIGPQNTTTMRLRIGRGSSFDLIDIVATMPNITTGNWAHVAVTYNGTMYKLFVNGNLIYQSGMSGPNYANHIGNIEKFGLGGNYALGSSEMGIYNFEIVPYVKFPTSILTLNAGQWTSFSQSLVNSDLVTDTVVPDRYYRNDNHMFMNFHNSAVNNTTYTDRYGNILSLVNDTVNQISISSDYPTIAGGSGKSLYKNSAAYNVGIGRIDEVKFGKEWTLDFWIKPQSTSYYQRWIGGIDDVQGFFVGAGLGGTNIRFAISTNNSSWAIVPDTGIPISYGVWQRITLTQQYLPKNSGYPYHFVLSKTDLAGVFYSYENWLRDPMFSPLGIRLGSNYSGEDATWAMADIVLTPYSKYMVNYPTITNYPSHTAAATIDHTYLFDISKMKMYKGHKGNWLQEDTLFLGEVEAIFGNNLNKVTTYALNGKFYQDNIYPYGNSEMPEGSPSVYNYEIAHNIGTTKCNISAYFTLNYIGNIVNGLKKYNVAVAGYYYEGTNPLSIIDSNYMSLCVPNNNISISHPNGNPGGYPITSGRLSFEARRSF